jgi:N6-L-threonylcarbamoyladenine synthase
MYNGYVLGIDTSNYKTSLAVIDKSGEIIKDTRMLLAVKQGERGLRQSEAFFQHVENLPTLMNQVFEKPIGTQIAGVAVSDKPRPIDGSYMPCFKAGYSWGQSIAKVLNVPLYQFSHQEGHIEAVKAYSSLKNQEQFLAWHLSGGTCELLMVDGNKIEIIGGSKDISFGQVIDRIGVLCGINFPAGPEMDDKACELRNNITVNGHTKKLTTIKLDSLYFNLSGIETQCTRVLKIEKNTMDSQSYYTPIIKELFDKLADCIVAITRRACEETDVKSVLFAGGVSCSTYISEKVLAAFKDTNIKIDFGNQELASDNAVGVALLGGKSLWL